MISSLASFLDLIIIFFNFHHFNVSRIPNWIKSLQIQNHIDFIYSPIPQLKVTKFYYFKENLEYSLKCLNLAILNLSSQAIESCLCLHRCLPARMFYCMQIFYVVAIAPRTDTPGWFLQNRFLQKILVQNWIPKVSSIVSSSRCPYTHMLKQKISIINTL
jgi:hypothetical protein